MDSSKTLFSLIGGLSAALTMLLTGCTAPQITNTGRGVIEQALLSTVSERAISQMRLDAYREQKALLDYKFLEPQVDKAYVMGMLEMHLANFGIVLVDDAAKADIIIQPLCGVLATDDYKLLLGTPPLPIPLPNTDLSIVIPEIALFKKITRRSFAHFNLNILRASDRSPLEEIRSSDAEAKFIDWAIFMIPFSSHSIPMLNHVETGTMRYEFF